MLPDWLKSIAAACTEQERQQLENRIVMQTQSKECEECGDCHAGIVLIGGLCRSCHGERGSRLNDEEMAEEITNVMVNDYQNKQAEKASMNTTQPQRDKRYVASLASKGLTRVKVTIPIADRTSVIADAKRRTERYLAQQQGEQ